MVVTYATLKLGAVINPLPPTYGWKDLAFIMNKSASKAVVVAGKFRSVDYTDHLARIQAELLIKPAMLAVSYTHLDVYKRQGVGFKTAMKVLDKGRLNIAAASTGAAERILNDALRYAGERKQFGKAIGEFQLIQAMLADSHADIYAARCMVIDAARKRDEGRDVGTEAACAKMFASEMLSLIHI